MRKLLCKIFGHWWYVSKWGGTTNLPFADELTCARCKAKRDLNKEDKDAYSRAFEN